MIAPFVGGPLDGSRIEVGDDPPRTLMALSPEDATNILMSRGPDPLPIAYTRREYVQIPRLGAMPLPPGRLYGYFCTRADAQRVVAVVMPPGRWPACSLDVDRAQTEIHGGGLYLAWPMDVRALARVMDGWEWRREQRLWHTRLSGRTVTDWEETS